METIGLITVSVLAAAAVLFGLLAWGKSRRQVEAVTTEGLISAAQAALDEAQRLVDLQARQIEADQAALASNRARIAQARTRMASGNAAP